MHGATCPKQLSAPAVVDVFCRIISKVAARGRDAGLDDLLEHPAKNISIAETLVAGARECRMIRDSILDTELAEPAIGEVHLYFAADQSLRADRKDIHKWNMAHDATCVSGRRERVGKINR